MKCDNCGFDNQEGSKFCKNCGTKLPEPKKVKLCKNCGAELGDGVKFCKNCGTKVEEATQPIEKETVEKKVEPAVETKKVEKEEIKTSTEKKKLPTAVLILIIVLIVAVVLGGVGFTLVKTGVIDDIFSSSSSSSDDEDDDEDENGEDDDEDKDDSDSENEEDETSSEGFSEGVHTYDVIVADTSYEFSLTYAGSTSGHMVTIESNDELQEIIPLLTDKSIMYYIGAVNVDGTFYWHADVAGNVNLDSEVDDSFWLDGQPVSKYAGADATAVVLKYDSKKQVWGLAAVPADIKAAQPDSAGKLGLVIEFE